MRGRGARRRARRGCPRARRPAAPRAAPARTPARPGGAGRARARCAAARSRPAAAAGRLPAGAAARGIRLPRRRTPAPPPPAAARRLRAAAPTERPRSAAQQRHSTCMLTAGWAGTAGPAHGASTDTHAAAEAAPAAADTLKQPPAPPSGRRAGVRHTGRSERRPSGLRTALRRRAARAFVTYPALHPIAARAFVQHVGQRGHRARQVRHEVGLQVARKRLQQRQRALQRHLRLPADRAQDDVRHARLRAPARRRPSGARRRGCGRARETAVRRTGPAPACLADAPQATSDCKGGTGQRAEPRAPGRQTGGAQRAWWCSSCGSVCVRGVSAAAAARKCGPLHASRQACSASCVNDALPGAGAAATRARLRNRAAGASTCARARAALAGGARGSAAGTRARLHCALAASSTRPRRPGASRVVTVCAGHNSLSACTRGMRCMTARTSMCVRRRTQQSSQHKKKVQLCPGRGLPAVAEERVALAIASIWALELSSRELDRTWARFDG